jgi:hypothetical protein
MSVITEGLHPGEHRAKCPECPPNKKPSLAIKVDGEGATWLCHRCGFKGAQKASNQPIPLRKETDWRPAVWAEINRAWEEGALLDESPELQAYMRSRRLEPDLPELLMLRFHPRVFYRHGIYHPAMLAPMVLQGKLVGLHATYLKAGGSGKAELDPARKVWKPTKATSIKGAAIPLYPIRAPRLAYTYLGVAEGVETALAMRKLKPGLPVWATVSADGMRSLELPQGINHLLVGADADDAGLGAARALAKRAATKGIRAIVEWPEQGDWNDAA